MGSLVAACPPAVGVLLTHRPPCPPLSRLPSAGYAFPQPLTGVTIVISQVPPDSSGLTHADIGI